MSISSFALSEPAIAEVADMAVSKKAPPKRTATALSDRKAVPEPR